MIKLHDNFIGKRRLIPNLFNINAFLYITLMPIVIIASSGVEVNRHQTNKNEITNFFDKEVEDRQGIEQFLENSRKESEQGVVGKGAVQALEISENELEGKTSELNSINTNSLESRGQEERAKEENNYYDQLEVDYNDHKIINHKKDIDKIADANERLMSRLIEGLRDLEIDCKTVKGNVEIEPEYHLEIEKEHFKDVTYNQHICEELRNRYNCSDTLTLTCKVKGIQWGEWQDKEIHVPGAELINFGKEIFWIHRTAPRCFEYKLSLHKAPYTKENSNSAPDPYHVLSMREFLAAKHNATIDNISTKMKGSWYGGIFSISGWNIGGRGLGSKDYSWNTYVINYQYREGNPACFDWQETWSEKCALK